MAYKTHGMKISQHSKNTKRWKPGEDKRVERLGWETLHVDNKNSKRRRTELERDKN